MGSEPLQVAPRELERPRESNVVIAKKGVGKIVGRASVCYCDIARNGGARGPRGRWNNGRDTAEYGG